MRSPLASAAAIAALLVVIPKIPAQTAAAAATAGRIHWYLARQLDRAQATDKLPIYVVMANQLRYEHWFPRVHRLHVDERRQLVVRELKAHAARTQRDVMDRLRAAEAAGEVSRVRSLWIGNFIKCDATPLMVRTLARLPGVDVVRFDATWPLDRIQDGQPPAPNGPNPGSGPINTGSHKVWALGFTGQGVVAMNADTGAAIDHGDLIHRKWTNPGEIPNNGIDDDHNGYVDDVNGYNFFDGNNNVSSGSLSHGTMTAGAMVADGSCSGTVTGEAPGARVMYGAIGACCPQTGPVDPGGEVAQWEAVQYAIDNGAHVQTSSHSYKNGFIPPPNYEMHRIVGDNSLAAGLIRCNSTSNNGAVANEPGNLARVPFNVSAPGNLPPPYLDPNQELVGRKSGVIGVGAHDHISNQLMSYSPLGPFAWHLEDVLIVNPSYPIATWNAGMNDYPWWNNTRQGLLKPDVTGPTNTLSLTTGVPCGLGASSGTSNATPRVAGCMILWKSANMSLGPEDMAMIVHQSAADDGSVPGKENGWGAGRVRALEGLYLALCVHRADGEPAWSITHRAGAPLTLEVDTLPGCATVIAPLTSRNGDPLSPFYAGSSGPTGEISVSVPIGAGAAGTVLYTRAYTACDRFGVVDRTLKSNVIEIRIVP